MDDPYWNHFWEGKLRHMSRQGVQVESRPLSYRRRRVELSDGREQVAWVGEEKGIDVRIALDVVRLALRDAYDVAVLFSQDQDLAEVAREIREIAREQGRWIKIACAFPMSRSEGHRRGIDRTDWIPIDRATYDACLDPRDYRPGPRP